MDVRTRFAPSPTGFLHIGGVRTALFNWLFARRHNGAFLLRIDDTDAERHVEEAVGKILDGFRWLGMDWDEGPEVGGPYAPYYQSQRLPLHVQALEQLIEAGWAYPDTTPEREVDELRAAASAAKRPFVYRGKQRELSPSEALSLFREQKPAVRFKVPTGQTTTINDHVRGEVSWETDLLGDFTIARGGAQPLYNLASIADDLAMKITHIVRAEEHLSNTHPQVLIARGLGAQTLPEFAHVPFITAPGSGKKLSKRDADKIKGLKVYLHEYRDEGYLSYALINALSRIGWSLDDHTEIMSVDTIIQNFSLDRITKSAAALDPDKMFWIQSHWMGEMPIDEKVEKLLGVLQNAGILSTEPTAADRAKLKQVIEASGDRLKLLTDIVRYGGMFFEPHPRYDAASVKTLSKDGSSEILLALADALAATEPFTHQQIEADVTALRDKLGVGGKINHYLRAGTTGRSVGPGVYDCAAILGREQAVANLRYSADLVEKKQLAATVD